MNSATTDKLVTVVVPVYNTDPTYIRETITSARNQTLDPDAYEILVVDDASDNTETQTYLRKLEVLYQHTQPTLRVRRHENNQWLAQTRITGARHASGKYIVFLDSDDMVSTDYLKKAAFLLETSPRAGWVYPTVRFFGNITMTKEAVDFDARRLLLYNYCGTASMYRTRLWRQVSQRDVVVTGSTRFLEDWDTLLRMCARGWHGLWLRDATFYYRRSVTSMGMRSPFMLLMTHYINQRLNGAAWLLFWRSNNSKHKRITENAGKRRFRWGPKTLLDRFAGMGIRLFSQGLYSHRYFPAQVMAMGAIAPRLFIHNLEQYRHLMTLAECRCGFLEKPTIRFDTAVQPRRNRERHTVMLMHRWWVIGGAEYVALDWLHAAADLKHTKTIDVVESSQFVGASLETQFSHHADEQHSLDRVTDTPGQKLRYIWNLIVHEQPNVILVHSSPALYALSPLIKQVFPHIQIIDMLHNDFPEGVSDFSVADEYKQYLDTRVVVSDTWKQVLAERYEEQPEKISVQHNLVDINHFNPDHYNSRQLRRAHQLPTTSFVVGFIGRFDHQKLPTAVVQLARLMQDDPRFSLFMVGDGPEREWIEHDAGSLPNLHIFPETIDTAPYYAMADIIVSPSQFEGYPLVGLEAAAMNTPIIATDVLGFREQIAAGRFGVLYEPTGNPHTEARAIRAILQSRLDDILSLGSNGRRFVERYHDRKRGMQRYQRFLRTALKHSHEQELS